MPLLKKDVRKLIKNLESGQYAKHTGALTNSKGNAFCCLGVWADQHGATWVRDYDGYKPIPKGKDKPQSGQSASALSSALRFGLPDEIQNDLMRLNDAHPKDKFKAVIQYLKDSVLPKAK